VKHRIGIDRTEDYDFMRRFVTASAAKGCKSFIVHARNAILQGLTPKENREIPPLRYELVYRLKREFPELEIVVNGGIRTWPEIDNHLAAVDGVMIGRAAENDPWLFSEADRRVFGDTAPSVSRGAVVDAMARYAEIEVRRGTPLRHVVRHMHGLYRGRPVARRWRQMLSDVTALKSNDPSLLRRALAEIEQREVALSSA
jgi:tRNA-dihydrouridine synthase A